jgi:hypothetical protein
MEKEQLRKLAEDNGLVKEDFYVMDFGSKKIPIITRTGIEKIQAKLDVRVVYEIIKISDDFKTCLIKATGEIDCLDSLGRKDQRKIETFGECSPYNNSQKYPVAMAEKRALSRVVLKLAGLYEHGVFGEVEADEFKK